MKHLYIIGNGFDIFSGLRTRYVDFRFWLEQKYPFIFENMSEAYEIEGEWWNDFERNLGEFDVKRFVSKYDPCKKSDESVFEQVKRRKELEQKYKIPPSLYYDCPCAYRLEGLLDILQYCFEKWISEVTKMFKAKYVHLEKENSFFINFNYTDTLQYLYKIPDERIVFIHGRASKYEHLVFGHDKIPYLNGIVGYDENKTCEVLGRYHKNPYEHLLKHDNLPDNLKDVEIVHVYGFSFSHVDEEYMDWIEAHTPKTCHWEISWHIEQDKKRIESFILDHFSLKNRFNLIKLDEIEKDKDKSETFFFSTIKGGVKL